MEKIIGGAPVTIVPRVIQHARKTKAEGTLIVPQWPSAPFWPMLFPEVNTTAKFVVDVCQMWNGCYYRVTRVKPYSQVPQTPIFLLLG